eukprot:471779_1
MKRFGTVVNAALHFALLIFANFRGNKAKAKSAWRVQICPSKQRCASHVRVMTLYFVLQGFWRLPGHWDVTPIWESLFLGPEILPGSTQDDQSSSSFCTLLTVLEMIRGLKFTRRKSFLDEMAKVLDRTKEIIQNNNGATCYPEDALVIIQAICTVIETTSQFLDREDFRIEAETTEFMLLQNSSTTSKNQNLKKNYNKKGNSNTNQNGKNDGTSHQDSKTVTPPWRKECGEGEGGGDGGKNYISNKSLHEWAEFLRNPPLLMRSSQHVLEPQAVEVKRRGRVSTKRRKNVKKNSVPPPSSSPIIIHEPLPAHSEAPSWFQLGEAVSVLSAMNGDRTTSSINPAGGNDHILSVLETHAKLLREALRQNAHVRCLWLEEKSRRQLEESQEMSVNKDNVVYLGSGHPLHELTVANGQLRERICQLETELGKALGKPTTVMGSETF